MNASYGARLRDEVHLQQIVRFKAALYRGIRNFLHDQDALELPMPVLWRTREGAPCDQWMTTDPVTGDTWFIRHCMEDHLRRMTPVFPRVFELGKAVRAERRSDWHATEFTVLEVVFADFDYESGMGLLERMLAGPVADAIADEFGPDRASVFRAVKRRRWDEIAESLVEVDPASEEFASACNKWLAQRGVRTDTYTRSWEPFEDLMKYGIEPACAEPTLIYGFPQQLQHVCALGSNGLAQRLSLVMHGIEFADGGVKFSEPAEYRRIYQANADYRREVLGLGHNALPEEFFAEMSSARQSVFTCGLGLDRLTALVAGRSVHEVIQFPEG